MGASHSAALSKQSCSVIISFRLVEYSRMRPHPVQVRLHVWRGSSCSTIANFGVCLRRCLTIWPAIFAESAKGNRMIYRAAIRGAVSVGSAEKLGMGRVSYLPRKLGKRNVIGVTVPVARNPVQPVIVKNVANANIAINENLRFITTSRVLWARQLSRQ